MNRAAAEHVAHGKHRAPNQRAPAASAATKPPEQDPSWLDSQQSGDGALDLDAPQADPQVGAASRSPSGKHSSIGLSASLSLSPGAAGQEGIMPPDLDEWDGQPGGR